MAISKVIKEMLHEPIVLTGERTEEALQKECAANEWKFSFDVDTDDDVQPEKIAGFVENIIQKRLQQVQEQLPEQGATFYFWFDKQAPYLAINVLSGCNRRPHFACNVRYVDSALAIIEPFVQMLKGVQEGESWLGVEESITEMKHTQEEDDRLEYESAVFREKFVVDVYAVNLKNTVQPCSILPGCTFVHKKRDFYNLKKSSFFLTGQTHEYARREELAKNMQRIVLTRNGVDSLTVHDFLDFLYRFVYDLSQKALKEHWPSKATFYYWFDQPSKELRYGIVSGFIDDMLFYQRARSAEHFEKPARDFFIYYTSLYKNKNLNNTHVLKEFSCKQEQWSTALLYEDPPEIVICGLPFLAHKKNR